MLKPGMQAPRFRARALSGNASFVFDTAAGRPMLLFFFASAGEPAVAAALDEIKSRRWLLDDDRGAFFGITNDPQDEAEARIVRELPGIRYFLDYDRSLATLYGALAEPKVYVLDRQQRIVGIYGLDGVQRALGVLESLHQDVRPEEWAPVLLVPRIFERDLCRQLIGYYEQNGGTDSGFMREQGGKTVRRIDHSFKRREDCHITDKALRSAALSRIKERLLPMVHHAFQFEVTRLERYIVACYDAEIGGHFRPHRDNTTQGTAHRRFAVTMNLNAEDYDGGELRFPEFGQRTYRAPTGGAVVFSCSLLHEATPVTRGRRYAFLPFLYDEEGGALRERNNAALADDVAPYKFARAS